jgi:hypothetical protein
MADQIDLEDWLSLLETHRPDYLSEARDAARKLLSERESITIDHVREVCPPPKGIDPRVMGAVFKHADFEPTGEYVQSGRNTCHRRPIMRFKLTNYAKLHAALGMKRPT